MIDALNRNGFDLTGLSEDSALLSVGMAFLYRESRTSCWPDAASDARQRTRPF
jgi:hypothetical protein